MGVAIMTRVILKGSKSCQWDLGSGFRGAGTNVDLTASEMKKAEKDNLIEEYIDKSIKTKKVIETKKYTEKELKDMNKAQQVEIIEDYLLKPARLEKGRIKQILEAQK